MPDFAPITGLPAILKRNTLLRGGDERAFLPAALEIVETPASPVGRMIAGTIVALIVVALLWACLGRVDIIATAPGRVVPIGKTKTVQPLETGTVEEIAVADGDHVAAGQLLVRLDAVEAEADRRHFARDLVQARLDRARLEGLRLALASGQPPHLVDPPKDASEADVAAAEAAMRSTAVEHQAKLASIDQEIVQKEAEQAEAQAQIERIQAALPLLTDEANIRAALRDREFGNKINWLQAEERRMDQQQQLAVMSRHLDEARAARLSLQRQREETVAEYEKDVLSDLVKTRAQANELEAQLTKATERLDKKTLTAPIDGTVQQLAIHTVGGVVTPAQPLMVIVPDKDGLMVEATVNNRDVGFVHEGQDAQLKVETFAFTRYGLIGGKVKSLSRDVVYESRQPPNSADETADTPDAKPKEAGYTARITLDRDWIETEDGRQDLGPGMSITAEIHTGRRRIIDYLLSPLVRRVDESLHER